VAWLHCKIMATSQTYSLAQTRMEISGFGWETERLGISWETVVVVVLQNI
jgi:predicted 3-demethylubiquinone-9 3-methyltransferase (glyoxalase superfamily)